VYVPAGVLISPTIAGTDDCDDWLVVVDPAALLDVVEIDKVEAARDALDTDDWAAELGTTESRVLVEDEGSEGSKLLVDKDGAAGSEPPVEDSDEANCELLLEDGADEETEPFVDEGEEEAGSALIVKDDGEAGNELMVDNEGDEGSELLLDDGAAESELLVEGCIVELCAPEGKSLLIKSDWVVELAAPEETLPKGNWLVELRASEGNSLLVEDRVAELGAPEGKALLLEANWVVELGATDRKELLVKDCTVELSATDGKGLLNDDSAAELGAADWEALIEENWDCSVVDNAEAALSVLLAADDCDDDAAAPSNTLALFTEMLWEVGAADWNVVERLDDWDEELSAAETTALLVEALWEVSAADCWVDERLLDWNGVETAPEATVLLLEAWEVAAADCWVEDKLDGCDELGAATEGQALLVGDACVVEFAAPESKTLLVEDEGGRLTESEVEKYWAVELTAANGMAEIDVAIVELGAPAEETLLVGEVWDVAAPDCKVKDDVLRVEKAAAPEVSVLKLAAENSSNGNVTVLDARALRLDELVWVVDWAAKMDVKEDELQSVADTVRVTVTAALVI
jgi:hypothetical protein